MNLARLGRYGDAVHGHTALHVAGRVGNDLATDGHPALGHEPLRGAARGHAGVGEEPGQTHGEQAATLGGVDLELLDSLADRAYRRRQVWEWAARGASSYDEMTNLPLALREELDRELPFSTLELEREARASDGTEKALFRTAEGKPVEAVLMRYRDGRRSLCLSSQSGCPLTCTFCATGQMRFGRNLSALEVLDQALHFRRRPGTGGREADAGRMDHAVFMGMG